MRSLSDRAFERTARMLTEEMRDHFVKRTNRHIQLVQKYCGIIEEAFPEMEGIIERGEVHDASKFEEPELTPYIWLTWRYKCEDEGRECKLPEGMKEEIDKATEYHILHNAHHPEASQGRTTDLINKKDRDAPPDSMVDATGMSTLDLGECLADWCAMSEERGNTPLEWAENNVNKRWEFTDTQCDEIFHILETIWKEIG